MALTQSKGRRGDTVLAHLTKGEIVIPVPMAEDVGFLEIISEFFEKNNIDIEKFTVGNKKNSTNPVTGQIEFGFFKDIVRSFKSIFSKPRTPDLPKPPEPIERIETVQEDAASAQRREKKKFFRGGRRATIISGIESVLKKRLGA